uniref:Uncharacterized protein n=1 Tax=Chromera velia CCMP2878 TaxID=1169474 RepID=A0A0G4GH83_9ALVE|eukprot:Cvel_21895.t1-p1 / transcript=Cvel_21895.t1 / gene=Cvel_21895 / organism=Chromera_velia_CCMP2878 / gene_product=hypothetical protein / transcript_product=hypothetical protein / location=Cvel_scaffold2096:21307-26730(-) / protein_length=112 / sequence_SO=supercontig / SO=protein_coding / is_pseudo=false
MELFPPPEWRLELERLKKRVDDQEQEIKELQHSFWCALQLFESLRDPAGMQVSLIVLGVLQALVREGVQKALRDSANVHRVLAEALEGTIRREVWTSLIEATTLLASLRYSE